jgi:tetratricopeptide (TPR) repeat protein
MRNKKILLIVLIGSLLFAGCIAIYYAKRTIEQETPIDKTAKTNELLINQQYDDAADIWQKEIDEAQDDTSKAEAYLNLGTVYMEKSEYQLAQSAFISAYELFPEEHPNSVSILKAVTIAAEENHDWQTAIDYTNEIIESLSIEDRHLSSEEIDLYKENIKKYEINLVQ